MFEILALTVVKLIHLS